MHLVPLGSLSPRVPGADTPADGGPGSRVPGPGPGSGGRGVQQRARHVVPPRGARARGQGVGDPEIIASQLALFCSFWGDSIHCSFYLNT